MTHTPATPIKPFTSRCGEFYRELGQLANEGRAIIAARLASLGGYWLIDDENDDPAWVAPEAYARELRTEPDGTIRVTDSELDTRRLDQIEDYYILDLANFFYTH